MSAADRVRELVEPLAEAIGLELVDVEHAGGLLRIYLDREGGIDLDALTSASEQISDLLDLHDPIPTRYTLEVSSPGLERPLRRPQEFQRYVGTIITVKTRTAIDGERRFRGELTEADDQGIVVDGQRIDYGQIDKARTVFEWGPTPPPARRGKPTNPSGKARKATNQS